MPATRSAAASTADMAAAVAKETADAEAEECAICFEQLSVSNEVKLFCGHKLHGQCAARHLQLDRRCPVCRKQPRTQIVEEEEDEDAAYDRMVDASEEIVVMRLVKKAKCDTLKALLMDFGVDEKDFLRQSKKTLAELASEQMHYETDDDDDEEEADEEDDEEDDDEEDGEEVHIQD